MLRELVEKHMERYMSRDPRVVYAHMLEHPVWAALRPRRRDVNGFMVVGELLHAGLAALSDGAEEACRDVRVSRSVADRARAEVSKRFIVCRGEACTVKVCGTADAIIDGAPVELKTTRRSVSRWSAPWGWVLRARVYGWLYGTPRAYLVVLNVVDGSETVIELDSLDTNTVTGLLEKWLLGLFPYATLTR